MSYLDNFVCNLKSFNINKALAKILDLSEVTQG